MSSTPGQKAKLVSALDRELSDRELEPLYSIEITIGVSRSRI